MPEVLIISDKPEINQTIEVFFKKRSWSTVTIGVPMMFARKSASVHNFACLILVIDDHFRMRFGCLISEMTAMIRNCSSRSPLYLVIEGDHDIGFELWSSYAKHVLKLADFQHSLQNAMHRVFQLETEVVPITAFISPMN